MAITLHTIAGPGVICPGIKIAIFAADLDGYLATDGTIDLTDHFTHVYSIAVGGNDALADNAIVVQAILPGHAVAITSANVKLSAFWSADGTDGEPLKEVGDNEALLAAIDDLSLVVIGK